MDKESQDSIFEKNIRRGIEKGFISISEDNAKITYHGSRDYTTSFKNPEEKVRASYFTELVIDYEYSPKRITFEEPVPRRTPGDRADIVVYEDDELKKPYIVIECKKDGITDAEFKQAIEQVFGNANSLRGKFASVVAGITKTAFDVAGFESSEREKNVISDIPKKYGRTPKYRFIKGNAEKELKIVSREELIRALGKSHDTVWQGGRLAPTTAFDEVSKLLFCKLRDEKSTKRDDTYKFQIGTHESADEVYERIHEIYLQARKEDSEVFKEDIRLDPKIVYNVVEHLQALAINKIDLDTKGVAFERFMQDFFKGKMGQFFTPRQVVQFCIKMLHPDKSELILDPACGSGGFLLNAMDKVRQDAESSYDEKEAWEHWHKFAMNNLYGIEINDQIARVCKMNMIIHDDGHTNVISTDTLRDIDEISNIHRGFIKDNFDIVLTNPPFGAVVKDTEKDYLDKYDLGKGRKNQKTEILFIERCIDFVKPKTGRIGIVLPDGILTNSSLQYVRDFIMERCQILAVISLPQFAFTHYGAGVKSSLVFLRKKEENEKLNNYPIFMAIAEHIGYDAAGRTDPINDLDNIYEEYKKLRDKTIPANPRKEFTMAVEKFVSKE
jgi:type I restriction enzyme M protein